MEELLKKLLEAKVLSEDTKTELETAIRAQLSEAIDRAKQEAEADTRAELTERWLSERDVLLEALDQKIDTVLVDEIAELKEDIERFRDLEAEYAQKLLEAKASIKGELKENLKELTHKLDTFLEIRLTAEIEELKEDIDVVRQNNFGRKIFETFAEEYMRNYADEQGMGTSLQETEKRLAETSEALVEAERKIAEFERSREMERVLRPLQGKQREVMEAILKNVKTTQLDEAYKTFIGRAIRVAEGNDPKNSEKETKVLAESSKGKAQPKPGIVKTGDDKGLLESEQKNKSGNIDLMRIKAIAGM